MDEMDGMDGMDEMDLWTMWAYVNLNLSPHEIRNFR